MGERIISNDILNTPIIIDHFNPRFYFHEQDCEKAKNANKKFLMTDIGKYSITKPQHTIWIQKQLTQYFQKKNNDTRLLSIIDCNAGLGGDSIQFSKYFKGVLSIEKDEIHHFLLQNNCEVAEAKNIEFRHDNFLNVIKNLQISCRYDLLFLDPPWGGPNYKHHEKITISIEDNETKKNIEDVLNDLYAYYKYVILKSPLNIHIQLSKIKYQNKIIKGDKLLLFIFEK